MTVFDFSESKAAFRHAERKARYGHRRWVVWQNVVASTWHAARMTDVVVERAVAESGGESCKFFGVEKSTGLFMTYGPKVACILLANLKSGFVASGE